MPLADETIITVPLISNVPSLVEQVTAARAAGAGLVELRVDCIHDIAAVEALLRRECALPTIVTVRSAAEGGRWSGDESERIELIRRLARLGPEYIDIELATWETAEGLRREIESMQQSGAGRPGLILSHHDFESTPGNLNGIIERFSSTPVDVIKAVFTAEDVLDSLRVLEAGRRCQAQLRKEVIALAMGEAGLPTRVLAKKFGTFLSFASLEAGAESASGQVTVAELRERYRWAAIGPRTRVFGVIGWPVSHSQSPRLHNAVMVAEGIDGVYLPLPVRPTYEALAAVLDYVTVNQWLDFAGMSVTLPHKQYATRWLEERGYTIGDLARRCEAVNTLVREDDGGWLGENTDIDGALGALRSVSELAGDGLAGRTVDVLGAGGVARAVVAGLVESGCDVMVFNRNQQRAKMLAQAVGCDWQPWEEREAGAGSVLVNCTSVGMAPDVDCSPVSAQRLKAATVVFDTIYNPLQTRMLCEAEACGCQTVSGIEMFVRQAALQCKLWHGCDVATEALRKILGVIA